MSKWNAEEYVKFEQERSQPAMDLVMRLQQSHPKTIVDLGCGPGNSTNILNQMFREAKIIGIDNAKEMIKKAQQTYPEISFCTGSVETLEGKYDLLFSNACLQWVANHTTLIPTLMDALNPEGIIAVQMPYNAKEPLYEIVEQVIANPKWGLQNAVIENNQTLSVDEYINILSKCASKFTIWESKYYHFLSDHQAMVDWIKSTKLRPYLEHLSEENKKALQNEILEEAKKRYPFTKNTEVVFGFNRLFFIAYK